ncbi:MAG: sugar isomerase [Clostridia bacterium]|nr:sugar isomerase [Clostridia bacterium]
MKAKKEHRAQINILTTLLRQLVATICGIVIPRLMIGAFGSVVYGATTSIAQFLAYISLFEGGIGRVARGALYKPLSRNDSKEISCVYSEIKRFFKNIGILFLLYAIILAIFYYDIADVIVLSRQYTFGLVIAISLSTFASYMGGIANMTLLHADQKQYLTNTIIMVTYVMNMLSIVILVKADADVMTVKLISSLVFIARPILYSYFVKRGYDLTKEKGKTNVLSQKWTGMGQHVAYFLHTNTDVVLLTLFADLKYVAVYSIYHLIVNSIWNIASSFAGGMEAALGEMVAKGEKSKIVISYRGYKALLTLVAILLFGTTASLLVPFVRLYTAGVSDANYIHPLFGMLLIVAEAMNCIALPCCTLPISANCLKETKWGSYGEAVINIVLSLLLIRWNPLLGVAIGTLCATTFKCIYYIIYSARHILSCSVRHLIRHFISSITLLVIIGVAGMAIFQYISISSYIAWAGYGVIVVLLVGCIATLYGAATFPQEVKLLANRWRRSI